MKTLDSQQALSASQFDRQAGNYGRGHILADTRDVAELLELIPQKHGPALDVATGGGHTGLALARAGYQPVVLGDLAPAMLENAAKLLAEEGFHVETALFPAETIPFPDAGFSLISCRVAAHHFSDVGAFVRETFRCLKTGGYFLLVDGSLPDADPETADWLHQLEKLRDPSHGRFLDRSQWTGLAESTGFKIESAILQPMLQPDLEWYFQAAATPPQNREKVRELIRDASPHVREAMQLVDTDGPVRWTWQRILMLAKKV